jgi:UDPglucose 6-dehydrogenase
MAHHHDFDPKLLSSVEARNERQKHRLFEKVVQRFGHDLDGFTFGLWGLAFKPGTDDMRDAPSVVLLQSLTAAGAKVLAYDPVAMDIAAGSLPKAWFANGQLTLAEHQYDALRDADALILVTEWKPFRHPDFAVMKRLMKRQVIFDGRNQYDPGQMRVEGFEYSGIGR